MSIERSKKTYLRKKGHVVCSSCLDKIESETQSICKLETSNNNFE